MLVQVAVLSQNPLEPYLTRYVTLPYNSSIQEAEAKNTEFEASYTERKQANKQNHLSKSHIVFCFEMLLMI